MRRSHPPGHSKKKATGEKFTVPQRKSELTGEVYSVKHGNSRNQNQSCPSPWVNHSHKGNWVILLLYLGGSKPEIEIQMGTTKTEYEDITNQSGLVV